MELSQYLCWDKKREQDGGKTFECSDSESAAKEAAEYFKCQDVKWPKSQRIFVKGPDGNTETFVVYIESIPHYSAVKIEHEPGEA